MLRRRHPNPRAFLPLLLGRGSPAKTAAACDSLPSLPPVRHFLERLLGGTGALSHAAPSAATAGGDPASLTVHFLRHSCGLAEPEAAAVAARVRFRSTKNGHAVLALLRGLGFPPASVARLVAAFPAVLSSTTIGAKFDFYRRELGLSDAEVRRFLLASPNRTITAGLDGRLRPNHQLLRDLLGTDKNVLSAVKQSMDLIYENLQVVLLPKLKALRDHGVTEEVLIKLVTTHPKALVHRSSRFDDGLAAMKDLGVSPSSGIFPYAFGVFSKMYESKWQRRMDNYLSLGWTEEQVRRAFVRHPYCMSVSDDKVRQLMQFFAEKLGWSPEYVSSSPTLLSFSYEKRVLPRCMVLDILASRGIIKQGIKLSHLTMSEKKFEEKYVTRYQEVVPQVLEAYGSRTAIAVK
ncbi:uncharacterized protein LOC133894818 [Phragmites australis]|uniref:uncharacterized protein LOC133894818 n=1 Tax=Phragmites australis TaxID=29695 RepID=UPI002D791FAB|nr:uncharacterized protein LOC133894818 [Phragmites australis]